MDIKSEKGVSLIEVLVVAGIMAVVGLGIATMMSDVHLAQNGLKYRTDTDSFSEEMRALLSSPIACKNSFGGITANASTNVDVPALYDDSSPSPPGKVKYSKGGTYGDHSILIRSMTLKDFTPGFGSTKAALTLFNNIETARPASGPQNMIRKINISVELDPADNKIISCVATAKMSDGIWQRSATNLNNIFYMPESGTGNVGIGTATPTSPLTLKTSSIADAQNDIQTYDYTNEPTSIGYNGYRARGSSSAPASVVAGDWFAAYLGHGYGATNFSGGTGMMIGAESNFTAASQPGFISFWTAIPNTVISAERMRLTSRGKLELGMHPATGGKSEAIISMNNQVGQGSINISGAGDNNETYSSINLLDSGTSVFTNSWSLVHKKQIGTSLQDAFQIAHWQSGSMTSPFTITQNDNVVILKDLTVNQDLHVNGNISSGGTVTAASDIRLKTAITTLTEGYFMAQKLNGVKFMWKKNGQQEIGFIAQEVEKVIPELVVTNEDGLKSIKYANITAILTEAFKVIDSKQKDLIKENEDLRTQLNKLSTRLDALESQKNINLDKADW